MVDPHHHFLLDVPEDPHPWLCAGDPPEAVARLLGDIAPVRRPYGVEDFLGDCRTSNVVKSVHVEFATHSADPTEETRRVQAIADRHGYPHGIVGFARLEEPGVREVLEEHARHPNTRGIRQNLNWDPDPGLRFAREDHLRDAGWRRGFALLGRHGFSFDVQVWPHQLVGVGELASAFPDTQFVLDHAGMPRVSGGAPPDVWRAGVAALAACANVAVKISGIGMLDHRWTVESIRPLVAATIEGFGVERCMFASNFPVDKLYSDYETLVKAFETIAYDLGLSHDERDALFYGTAARVYRLV